MRRHTAATAEPTHPRRGSYTAAESDADRRQAGLAHPLTGLLRGEDFHNLHWQKRLELSLDCFICQRTRRTTSSQHGQEHALCSAHEEHPEHPTAARVAAFDVTDGRERAVLRAVVDYWWAPFHDTKRDHAATALSLTPRVRLHLGYYCPQARQSGTFSVQTNIIRPVRDTCGHCDDPLATSKDAPAIRLLA
ncbi:hypothetical protein ABZ468_27250 [Streptomyces sp. NPDC005708]|uniref:hypothetical protein n=1 Tax=unclassified Streptomyces TaxID=2593676 RepID=UPI0033D4FE75